MGVYKEIAKADGSGITTFYRLSEENSTVETTSTGTTETMFDYNDTLNKPSINDIALVGNKTLDELGIQPAGDYITEIPAEYITEEELEAKDYATEAFVIEQINNTEHFHREIVDALPLIGKDNIIYLVPKKGSDKDIYNEYIWTGVGYESIGTTAVDLTDYYQKNEVDELLDNKVNKVSGKQLSTNDYTTDEKTKLASLENYDDTELRNKVNNLHNYDDTAIRLDIQDLKNNVSTNEIDITSIENELGYKAEVIRLVKNGDWWLCQDAKGNNLTLEMAMNRLGLPKTILLLENLENDGKYYPVEYELQEKYIDIIYKDLDGIAHHLNYGYNEYLTNTASGDYIHLEDSINYPYKELSVNGVCEQETRSGKNLYNINIKYPKGTKITESGVDVTFNDDSSITLNGTMSGSNIEISGVVDTLKLYIDNTKKYYILVKVLEGSFSTTGNARLAYDCKTNDNSNSYYRNFALPYETTSTLIDVTDTDYLTRIRIWQNTNLGTSIFDNYTIQIALYEDDDTILYESYGASPSPDYPSEIKTIENSLNITSNNGELEDGENYLFSQITANLPEGEFIGKIDDTYKDTLKIEYNEEDGQYHLNLYKDVGKVVLDGSDDEVWEWNGSTPIFFIQLSGYKNGNYSVLSNMFKYSTWDNRLDENTIGIYKDTGWEKARLFIHNGSILSLNDFKTWLSAHNTEAYYVLAESYKVDLGVVDMPITYEGQTNLFTDSDLLPTINIEYYTEILENAKDNIIGQDIYLQDEVDTLSDLPTEANKGDIRKVKDTEDWYIYDGAKWSAFDKASEVDLSNYLAKDNTIAYKPATDYNPSTKKYVDDSIADIFIPTKTSQLTNDSGFVLKSVNDLTNYYNKSNTYNKAEVNALVAGGGGGESLIEILDITNNLDVTSLLNEGSHIFLLQGEGKLSFKVRQNDSQSTINLYEDTLVFTYYDESGLSITYLGLQEYGNVIFEGIPNKNSVFEEISEKEINYIDGSSKAPGAIMRNYINITTSDLDIDVYLNGSEEITSFTLPHSTLLIGKASKIITGVSKGLIIFPTGEMYTITKATVLNLYLTRIYDITAVIDEYGTKQNMKVGDDLTGKTVSYAFPDNIESNIVEGEEIIISASTEIGDHHVILVSSNILKYRYIDTEGNPNTRDLCTITNGATGDLTDIPNFTIEEVNTSHYLYPYLFFKNQPILNRLDELEYKTKNTYSTEEQVIGTWIDNKPLYRKTIDFGSLPNATYKEVAHNISNLNTIVNVYGSAIRSDKTSLPLPYTGSNYIELYVNDTEVNITTASDRSLFNGYVTLEYTKTAD